MTQEQKVRTREEQLNELALFLAASFAPQAGHYCDAEAHIKEAEARGAAEATKNSAPAAWQVRDMRGGVGDWKQCSERAHEEYKKHSTVETRALYAHPTNVAALEARVKGLEKALGFYADPNNYIDSGYFEGDPDLVTPKAIPVLQHGEDGTPCDCGDTARAALKREEGV